MPYDAKGNWIPPTAEETAIQAPAWYADPINYAQAGSGVARTVGTKIASLGPQAAVLPPIQGPMPLGVAGKIKEVLPQEMKDIGALATKIGEKMGVSGGKLTDKALTFGVQKPITTVAGAAQGTPFKDEAPVVKKPVATKVPSTPEALPPGITPAKAGETPASVKPHPAAGTKDLWDYASRLSPEKLKSFVDKNANHPDLKGVGYVETKDPATGKMRIVPTIERPKEPQMNAEQLTAMGHYQQGLGMVANAREAMDIRREGVEANKETRKEATRVREQQGEDALIKTFGQYEDSAGNKDINPSIAMFKLIDSGYDTSTLSKQW
jgi:hypothetical protein